jgi:hypothetical protein
MASMMFRLVAFWVMKLMAPLLDWMPSMFRVGCVEVSSM